MKLPVVQITRRHQPGTACCIHQHVKFNSAIDAVSIDEGGGDRPCVVEYNRGDRGAVENFDTLAFGVIKKELVKLRADDLESTELSLP